MELRHLRYLVAVAEEKSFLKAAKRLRVAQSALSRQIQDLEREIGVRLFHRVPRGVVITPAGMEFLREARSTLDNAERAVLMARHAQGNADHVLRFGHSSLIARAGVILDLLSSFRRGFPATGVEMFHLDEGEQRSALTEQKLDIAASFLAEPLEKTFRSFPLVDCSCTGALIPADHPLAVKDRIHLGDLTDLTYLSPPSHRYPRICRAIANWFAAHGLVVTRRRFLSDDTHTGIMEVAAGGAWVLANEAYGVLYGDLTSTIVFRQFVEPAIPFQLALIWHQDSPSPLIQPLVEIARKSFPENQVA